MVISKKLIVTLAGALILLLNRKLGLGLDPQEVLTLASVIGVYVIGQGIADHGAQGAATAAKRAIKDKKLNDYDTSRVIGAVSK